MLSCTKQMPSRPQEGTCRSVTPQAPPVSFLGWTVERCTTLLSQHTAYKAAPARPAAQCSSKQVLQKLKFIDVIK